VSRRQAAAGDADVTPASNRQDVETSKLTEAVIGAAMQVHSALGPGLLESAYRACMVHELHRRGFRVRAELPLPISYDGLRIDVGYRIDLLVEDTTIVELKAVEKLLRIHEAQLLSYLKLSGLCVGLLVNFCVPHLRLGIKRMVNHFQEGIDR
jgi:GxxExxY protein